MAGRCERLDKGRRVTVLLLLAAFVVGSCGGGGGPESGPGPEREGRVVIRDFSFDPATLLVAPGATVTAVNRGGTAHTVTSDQRLFDTGAIPPGGSAQFPAPTTSGDYPYRCSIHPSMRGVIRVSG